MKAISATELVRNFRQLLDAVEHRGEELVIVRNQQEVARLVPGAAHQTAVEAMSDLYRTLPEQPAQGWAELGRESGTETLQDGVRDPWAS